MVEKSAEELEERISFLENELEKKCIKKEFSEKFEQLLNTSHDPLYNRNLLTNKYDYISKSIYDTLGFTAEEFIHLPLDHVLKLIHPDDIIIIENFFRSVLDSQDKPATKPSIEYRIKDKSGNYHWINESITVIKDKEGNPTNLLGNMRDVTNSKKTEILLRSSEEKFRKYIESSPVGIYTTNKNGDCTYANNHWLEMSGLKLEQALGKGWLNALHPEDKWSISEKWNKAVQSNGKWGYEYRFKNTKEDIIWIYGMAVALKEDNGDITGYLGSNIDITAIKNAELQLKQNEKELKELNNTKDKFFSIIAHDLKGPFSSVIGFSQLLLKHVKNKQFDKIENFTEIILQEAQSSMSLLTNLLDWSRSQTGQIKFNPQNFNITEIITHNINLVETLASKKKIRISFQKINDLIIYADENMLNTIIRNLLSNAIKFTDENGLITLKITTKQNKTIISVSDTGVGMDSQKLKKLFKLDKDTSTHGTKNEKGTGLGLILCKEFVENHNGKIKVDSEIEKGTTFHIEIPK
jgi:PAS domain S-box-containing protein